MPLSCVNWNALPLTMVIFGHFAFLKELSKVGPISQMSFHSPLCLFCLKNMYFQQCVICLKGLVPPL